MRKKICLFLVILVIMSSIISIANISFAGIVEELGMENVNQVDNSAGGTGIFNAINGVIGLIQYVGSGIALIVITILGIKYILASPSEKADVKKSVMPILIGCILLFGGVNIAAAIATFTAGLGN